MMDHHLSIRPALLVWALTSGATLLSVMTATGGGHADVSHMLGLGATAVVMLAGTVKAWLILQYYLGLGQSGGAWRGLFAAFLIIISAGVFIAQFLIGILY
ncbi:cytochrome C oxidase subunit IV family protein [Thalassospira profundimaris]|uniref:cytochrome C oxidase subunit IV family protein n=1 Tax=Thalassospira profundimaris TaxID=502049 RepID=UPI000DEDB519|nr:cytochrome C oxidase subunit IV family protein [Thalassospira profundimaris]